MINQNNDVDALLKARADIDEQLRLHKNSMTVLFTDVVGSTSFFERNGDTAGLAMIHCHDELTSKLVVENNGRVVKTIGDSVMAEFPDAVSATCAAIEIERQFLKLNLTLQANRRIEVRIGIHTGVGFRKGEDLFGDVVNVAARITKRTGPAQILVSQAVYESCPKNSNVNFQWLSKFTLDGRTEKEDIFEVVWTDTDAYREIRERLSAPSGIPARYDVLSELGSGGTGIVYKVRDRETEELIALKMLKPELAADPAVQENFKRESCLARKITHKNVCRIHEFSRSAGRMFTTMELVEGESMLSRLYRAGAVPVAEATQIVRQMCDGLREAHSQGVVHRDLKPANIMIDRSGTVKIMDFGIARLIEHNGHMTGTIVGTPAYMAPEQAELKPVSAATDIYAVGLVLYEMVTGTPAFNGDTPIAVALKQIRETPKRPREIIPDLAVPVEQVILKCLQKAPAERYQSVDELDAALRRATAIKQAATTRLQVAPDLRKLGAVTSCVLRNAAERMNRFVSEQNWKSLAKYRAQPVVMLGAALILIGGVAGVAHWRHHSGKTISAAYEQQKVLASSLSPNPTTQVSPKTMEELNFGDKRDRTNATAVMQPVDSSDTSDIDDDVDLTTPASVSVKSSSRRTPSGTGTAPSPKKLARTVAASSPAAVKAEQVGVTVDPPVGERPISQPAQAIVSTAEVISTSAAPEAIDAKDGKEEKPLFLEVATFKDETWAQSAVDKLTSLGFQAFYLHKTKLWLQSYRVEVGPFANTLDMETIRQDLSSRGYKVKALN